MTCRLFPLILLSNLVILYGCSGGGIPSGRTHPEGEELVQQYCGSCHQAVTARYLDKKTWLNSVLPEMAPRLGIKVYQRKQYYPDPNASAISFQKWNKIVTYFKQNAPEKLKIPDSLQHPVEPTDLFTVRKPQWEEERHNIATTSLVAINSASHRIYTSDATYNRIYRWNMKLQPAVLPSLKIPAVDVSFVRDSSGTDHAVFTSVGTMRAVNVANGQLWDLNMQTDSVRLIGDGLPRPVHSVSGDFNRDNRRNWVVCGFGHEQGGLYLFEQQASQQFTRKKISAVPGAIDAETGDFNGDGRADLMVLFAHGNEGIWLMLNDQKGGFTARNLLQFPPVYGSTSFQLKDFNGDELPDILYTAGDNADYSQILKPYHGIYIFINRGDLTFEQQYFYHLNGATEAIARDFDGDGDPDIAAHAFFADLKEHPSESFVYLEQQSELSFAARTPNIHQLGRWLTMDVGDLEGDGDPDIVLGNYSRKFIHQQGLQKNWNTRLPFILLSNNTR